MEQHDDNQKFSYTYSAKEQEEIKEIRKKYTMGEDTSDDGKMQRLRRLDRGVTQKATVFSLLTGISGTLILGTGMSFIMTDTGQMLPSSTLALCIGTGIGIVGIAGMALAYPVYNHIIQKERKRIAPDVLRLTDELLK